MRIPGVDTLSRIPVPAVVRSGLEPLLRPATAYAVAVAGRLDRLVDQAIAEVLRRVDLDEAVRRVDVEAVLDRVDLTQTVLRRVDLEVVVRVRC